MVICIVGRVFIPGSIPIRNIFPVQCAKMEFKLIKLFLFIPEKILFSPKKPHETETPIFLYDLKLLGNNLKGTTIYLIVKEELIFPMGKY